MALLRSLFERRSVEDPARPLTDASLLELFDGTPTLAGVSINERKSTNMSAVFRAWSVIAGVGASMPIHAYRKGTREKVVSPILEKPNPAMTPFEFWEFAYGSCFLWGNAYALKRRARSGRMMGFEPLQPEWVKVGRFKPDGVTEQFLPSRKVYELSIPGEEVQVLTDIEMLHIPALGYDGICGVSPVRAARQAVGMSLAAEEYGARLFGNGSLMSGVLQTDQRLEEPQAEALKRRWQQKVGGLRKAHEVAVLDSGAKFQQISIPPGDAQFIESRRFQVTELARFSGLPPHMLFETDKSTSWGSGIEQQSLGFVVYSLRPTWLTRFEQRITKDMLLDPNLYASYSVEGLLRGDSKARAEFYASGIQNGWLNADEVRDLEDRPPIPDGKGQTYLQPLNMTPKGGEG